jgi:hypothetical protein
VLRCLYQAMTREPEHHRNDELVIILAGQVGPLRDMLAATPGAGRPLPGRHRVRRLHSRPARRRLRRLTGEAGFTLTPDAMTKAAAVLARDEAGRAGGNAADQGPAAMATPLRPDQAPDRPGPVAGMNDASRIARLPGVSSAAPTPWSTFVMMTTTAPGASPHAEARANHTMPVRYTFRLPEPVAERTADQQERCQRQDVAGHHPLQGRNACVEITPDDRQCDIDDRGVKRRDPGAQDGDRQHPPPRCRGVRKCGSIRCGHIAPAPVVVIFSRATAAQG